MLKFGLTIIITLILNYRNSKELEAIIMFVGTTEAAECLGISGTRLRVLLKEGRVQGAYKSGKIWIIPLYNAVPVIAKRARGPKPRWKTKRVPAKSIIHVNRDLIRQNGDLLKQDKDRTDLYPVIAVKHCQQNMYGHEIAINGPCRITYRPDAPKCFGATVWIETLSSVDIVRSDMAVPK
ncbi:DNA-binding protein [Crocosphaera sp. XPORK-15E]|uniref:DNA-binding protein n=1 Tax=Crocosphaera sp. XPORK-15E TaxID=3110247 RepID=UPI002B20890A|nr:DNA-binding protein [Crocosphaera sp. XPORK-15E]MEA5532528.1 DNA-binding protein [Crocosphaera sp. XPORK-15E]